MTKLHIVWGDNPNMGHVFFGTVYIAYIARIGNELLVSPVDHAKALYLGPDETEALRAVEDYIISTESGE